MKNLSDDEMRDINDLVSNLAPEDNVEQPIEGEISTNGPNGEALPEVSSSLPESPSIESGSLEPNASNEKLFKLISLQNDRLAILNKKIDVLTRLVELILRANLEDVE